MAGDTVTLQESYTTRFGTVWPPGTEVEVEQKLRAGWQCGYRTPDGRVGTQSLLRDELPPEVRIILTGKVGTA
jgi:hypothetical protein